jgi:hypothetical protein
MASCHVSGGSVSMEETMHKAISRNQLTTLPRELMDKHNPAEIKEVPSLILTC